MEVGKKIPISGKDGEMKDDFNDAARCDFCDLPNLSEVIDGNDELEKYRSMLPDTGLSKDQERQALQALKLIIFNMVLLSFDTHPTQEACGQRGAVGSRSVGCSRAAARKSPQITGDDRSADRIGEPARLLREDGAGVWPRRTTLPTDLLCHDRHRLFQAHQ